MAGQGKGSPLFVGLVYVVNKVIGFDDLSIGNSVVG